MAWRGRDRHSRWNLILATGAVLAVGFIFAVTPRRHGKVPPFGPNKPEWATQTGPKALHLDITSVIQYGDIYEIVGSAEAGSSVMINGRYAPLFFENSTFKYFVGPLPDGVTVLTITAQNENGGVATKQVALTAP
jgi:hypothetical protein